MRPRQGQVRPGWCSGLRLVLWLDCVVVLISVFSTIPQATRQAPTPSHRQPGRHLHHPTSTYTIPVTPSPSHRHQSVTSQPPVSHQSASHQQSRPAHPPVNPSTTPDQKKNYPHSKYPTSRQLDQLSTACKAINPSSHLDGQADRSYRDGQSRGTTNTTTLARSSKSE